MPKLEINATQPWLIAPDGNVVEITRSLAITRRSIRHSTFGFRHSPRLAPQGMAGFVIANGSMTSNQSGEGEMEFLKKMAFLSLGKNASSWLRKLVALLKLARSQFIPFKPATVLS